MDDSLSLPERDSKFFAKDGESLEKMDRIDSVVKGWALGQMTLFESKLHHM